MNTEPVLCYISKPWAYFTTQKLEDQWGDDWDDAPYEHNAGEPYGPCWHNHPSARFDPNGKRGWKPGTETPLEVGELCRCNSCKRGWNEDGTPKWELIKVAYDGDFETPCDNHANSPYSVERINAGAIPWLVTSSWTGKPIITIPAGTPLDQFIELVRKAGGTVFTPHPSFTTH